jgi:CO dehydrogenase nickel-insertion accessory protein CooC1
LAKLAVLGKGGSGKTLLAALLTRALAERGAMVLAVDLDVSPGLAVTLGVPRNDRPLPEEAIEPQAGMPYGWGLATHLTAAEAVRRYGTPVSDRAVFFGYGNVVSGNETLSRYLTAARQVAEGFDEQDWVVVADLPAGPTTAFEGFAAFASPALITVEATPTSVLTAQRLVDVLSRQGTPHGVVGMKTRGPEDLELLAEHFGLLGHVPYDQEVRRLARRGPVFGIGDDEPAVVAVRRLVVRMGL